jgi:regulator of replication initiation timing
MGILDNAKEVAKAVQEIHNLELYQRVLALHSDIIELVEENNKLRLEAKLLRDHLEIKAKLHPIVAQDIVYFLEREGQADDGPFCQTCWDIDHKLVRVLKQKDGSHWCDYCSRHRPRG